MESSYLMIMMWPPSLFVCTYAERKRFSGNLLSVQIQECVTI